MPDILWLDDDRDVVVVSFFREVRERESGVRVSSRNVRDEVEKGDVRGWDERAGSVVAARSRESAPGGRRSAQSCSLPEREEGSEKLRHVFARAGEVLYRDESSWPCIVPVDVLPVPLDFGNVELHLDVVCTSRVQELLGGMLASTNWSYNRSFLSQLESKKEDCCTHDTIMALEMRETLEVVDPKQRRVKYFHPQPVARREFGS